MGTKWYIEKEGKIFRFYVAGITSTGTLDKFEIISYELKYEFKEDTQVVTRDKIMQLIREGIMVPDWDKDGSMSIYKN